MNMLPLEPGSPFEASFLNKTPVNKWDTEDVNEWLQSMGLSQYCGTFLSNDIDGSVLLLLDKESLKGLINRVGDRIHVQKAIKKLRYRDNLSEPPSASTSRFDDALAGGTLVGSTLGTPSTVNFIQELPFVYPDGQTRTVSMGPVRSAIDVKHTVLREVFPTIGKTAASAWAISRGDKILSEQEVIALANDHSKGVGLLRIHQIEPPTAIASRQRSLHRPTSRHVSRHLKDYFPGVPSGELEQTIRKSGLVTTRLSTYDPGIVDVRRMSNILGEKTATSGAQPSARKPSSPQIEAQKLLDQYKQEEATPSRWIRGQMIGSGSFGTVYMGMNAFTGELLAVKQVEMPNNGSIDEGRKKKMVDALKHEVHLMRDFDHENIVQYRGFKHEHNTLNIFLEYVPGGSLVSMLNQYGSFEEKLVANYVKQIIAGLDYLHQRQVIHRDIKGANILVDDKGHCKISDFGLSKKMETQQLLQSNRQSMQGSSFWMAPEVVKQMSPTMKSDIWSLGCLVIELITGNHPFPQLTQMQAIFKLGNMKQPQFPGECSAECTDFLAQTLETDPTKRPTAKALQAHPFVM